MKCLDCGNERLFEVTGEIRISFTDVISSDGRLIGEDPQIRRLRTNPQSFKKYLQIRCKKCGRFYLTGVETVLKRLQEDPGFALRKPVQSVDQG